MALAAVTPPAVSPLVNWFWPESCLMSVWSCSIWPVTMPVKGADWSHCSALESMRSASIMSFSQSARVATSIPALRSMSSRPLADIRRFISM